MILLNYEMTQMKKNIIQKAFILISLSFNTLISSDSFWGWSKKITPFVTQQTNTITQLFYTTQNTIYNLFAPSETKKTLSPILTIHNGHIEYSSQTIYKNQINKKIHQELDEYEYPTILNNFNYDEIAPQIEGIRCIFIQLPYIQLAKTYNNLHKTDHSAETLFDALFDYFYAFENQKNNNPHINPEKLKECFLYLLKNDPQFLIECFDTSLMNSEESIMQIYQSTGVSPKEFNLTLDYKKNIPYFFLAHRKFPQNIISKHIIIKDKFIEPFFNNFFEDKGLL